MSCQIERKIEDVYLASSFEVFSEGISLASTLQDFVPHAFPQLVGMTRVWDALPVRDVTLEVSVPNSHGAEEHHRTNKFDHYIVLPCSSNMQFPSEPCTLRLQPKMWNKLRDERSALKAFVSELLCMQISMCTQTN